MAALAAGLESEWLDLMVKNLKDELQSQVARVRLAARQPGEDEAKMRASDARTLGVLERTLERLAKLERERAMVRESKVRKLVEGTRAALECRLDKLLEPQKPGKPARRPQR